MSFAKNTGKTIQQAFELYHSLNPKVYEEFKTLAFAAINKGKKKISFKMILNVIRWERFLSTEEPTTVILDDNEPAVKFKINDAYGSRYARLFIKDFPQHEDKIELRELRS